MNTTQIDCFKSVAKTGSITAAAELIHLSSSATAKNIKNLETELNVKLFEKTPRGSMLTKAGVEFLKLSDEIDGKLENFQENFSELQKERLNIGIDLFERPTILNMVAIQYSLRHPNSNISYIQCEATNFVNNLYNYKIDGFFTFNNNLVMKDCNYLKIGTFNFIAIVPNNHLLADKKSCFNS